MRHYQSLLRYLKKHVEFSHPLEVRRLKLPDGLDGDCCLHEDKFRIRIEKSLTENYAMDVLIHEVAHAKAWHAKGSDHGPAWGAAYSYIYRKYLEWLESIE